MLFINFLFPPLDLHPQSDACKQFCQETRERICIYIRPSTFPFNTGGGISSYGETIKTKSRLLKSRVLHCEFKCLSKATQSP